jgi:hypothetical protein
MRSAYSVAVELKIVRHRLLVNCMDVSKNCSTLQITSNLVEEKSDSVEKVFSGTVEAVIEHECEICKAVELSLRLKTSAGTPEVRLGPKTLFEEHNFTISRGDTITVTCLHYRERSKEIVLANEVRKDGETLVLRGEHGRPA